MPTFDFQDDMDSIFLASGFQESIVYTPFGGTAKTINAIVNRGGIRDIRDRSFGPTGRGTRQNDIDIKISTHATTGVATVTKGKDTVSLKKNEVDTSNSDFIVASIIGSDAGAWHLGIS